MEEGGSGETIDWTMMQDLLNQPDNDIMSAPATDQDMLQLSAALSGFETGQFCIELIVGLGNYSVLKVFLYFIDANVT